MNVSDASFSGDFKLRPVMAESVREAGPHRMQAWWLVGLMMDTCSPPVSLECHDMATVPSAEGLSTFLCVV